VSRVIDEHREYLSDRHRVNAFSDALAKLVRPGDVVIDLGAGTGILGLLACQAGAGRVYAIDEGPILGLARDIAAANGYADRIVHLRGLSTHLTIPEPADLVVTDQIGNFGFDAGAFEYLPDVRRRLLRPGGGAIPHRLAIVAAPCACPEATEWVNFWKRPVCGLDFSRACPAAGSTGYPVQLDEGHLLAAGAVVAEADVAAWSGGALRGTVRWSVERHGRFDGIGGWFAAVLAPGVVLTNAPGAATRINRRNVLLPVDPLDVRPGDQIEATMVIQPVTAIVSWSIRVLDAGGVLRANSRRSTFEGMLISSEDVARTRPGARLSLSRAGQARRLVLELCDGSHSVQEIEREVAARFADLFQTADAARFVAETLVPYGQ
jgi:protein arginine N-methyltransferase 1